MGSRQIKSGDSSVRCEEGTVRVDAPDGFFVNGDISVGGTGGSDGSSQFSGVTEGGQVIWSSAYTFRVAAAIYYIQGIRYTSIEQTISLDTAHATLDRIDVIVLGTDELVAKVTGTAAAQPSEPDFDPSTQVKLTFVYVAAASSAPSGVSNEDIYLENTEWTSSTSGSGFNANSTNNPRTSSKSIEGTTVANAAYVQLERGSSETLDSFATLIIFIRSKATWNANRGLRVQFFLAGVAKGSPVTIADGYWGYSSAITSGYQLIAIPISQFVLPFGQLVNQLRITDFGGSIGFYIDDISLQTASTAVSGNGNSGITQDAADARYLQQDTLAYSTDTAFVDADYVYFYDISAGVWKKMLVSNFRQTIKPIESFDFALSDESTDLTTGTAKVTYRMPYAFTITAVRSSVNTAPTGSTLIVDINEGGTTILSTKLSIDASEKTSTTAATAAVISDASLADDAEITFDIDQIGSTIAGKGLKVSVIGYRT